jgi:hypothetical protein
MDELIFLKLQNIFQIDKYFPFSFVFLLILTFFFYKQKSEERKIKFLKFIFSFSLVIFILWSIFLSVFQYLLWKQNSFSKYLLPPYQKISYFLSYAYLHFWQDLIFRILISLLIIVILKLISFTLKRDVFYDEEKILIPQLALFLVFPLNILFFYLSFFLLLLLIVISILSKKMNLNERYSFKNYWILLTWFIFLLQPFLFKSYTFLKLKP